MKVGDLVKLAKWCEHGPALMQIMSMESMGWGSYIAIFLEGSEQGQEVSVHSGNIFALDSYDEAMKNWNERR